MGKTISATAATEAARAYLTVEVSSDVLREEDKVHAQHAIAVLMGGLAVCAGSMLAGKGPALAMGALLEYAITGIMMGSVFFQTATGEVAFVLVVEMLRVAAILMALVWFWDARVNAQNAGQRATPTSSGFDSWLQWKRRLNDTIKEEFREYRRRRVLEVRREPMVCSRGFYKMDWLLQHGLKVQGDILKLGGRAGGFSQRLVLEGL